MNDGMIDITTYVYFHVLESASGVPLCADETAVLVATLWPLQVGVMAFTGVTDEGGPKGGAMSSWITGCRSGRHISYGVDPASILKNRDWT
jgi:hypothetical protein